MITQTILGFLATLIVRWFSRWREYRADAGGANLTGRHNMIKALERLQELQRPAQLVGSPISRLCQVGARLLSFAFFFFQLSALRLP